MSNWKIEAGKAIWKTGKNLLTSKKGGVEAITGVRPGTKFKGQKSEVERKIEASISRIKQGRFEFQEGVKKAIKKMKKIEDID